MRVTPEKISQAGDADVRAYVDRSRSTKTEISKKESDHKQSENEPNTDRFTRQGTLGKTRKRSSYVSRWAECRTAFRRCTCASWIRRACSRSCTCRSLSCRCSPCRPTRRRSQARSLSTGLLDISVSMGWLHIYVCTMECETFQITISMDTFV